MDWYRSRPGFEYRYRFQTTDCEEIITDKIRSKQSSVIAGGNSVFLFEFRTNFILKGKEGDEKILDSQRFEGCIDGRNDDQGFVVCMGYHLNFRLKEYWMPEYHIKKLAHDALDLSKSMIGGPPRVIPMIVWIDVCTVQQEGEELDKAKERAIRAEKLLPYELCTYGCTDISIELARFLAFELLRIRVEDDEHGLHLMKSCPICHRSATTGAQITVLPSCAHAFHSHCIVGWMRKNKSNSCPLGVVTINSYQGYKRETKRRDCPVFLLTLFH